jgi:hypothetical protein
MATTDELDDRMHIVEQDVRLLRGDMMAMRREMDARFTRLQDTIDQRFDQAGAQMERIIEMLGRLTPRT